MLNYSNSEIENELCFCLYKLSFAFIAVNMDKCNVIGTLSLFSVPSF